MRRLDATLLDATLLAVTLGASGCYLSHEPIATRIDAAAPVDGGTDAPIACTSDRECDDLEPCTIDSCVASRCAHDPIPLVPRGTFPTRSGWGTGSHAGEALVAESGGGTIRVRRFGADGDRGVLVEVEASGERVWDTALASTGDDLAILTSEGSQIALRMASRPDQVERAPGAMFVELVYTGRELVAISDNFDGCEIVWATREGRFLEGTARRSAACNHTQVLSSGHPSSHRPVRASPGQVILWSMDSDGRVDELSLAPDSAEAVSLALSEPGPRFFHSLMALEHEGRTGALWVRTEDDARREVHFGLVSREGERLVPSMTQITQADDSPYVVRMSIAWCAGRFVAAHESESQLWVQQMDANGRPIGEPLALDDSVPSGGRRTIACFEGGALVTTWSEAHVLGCE